MNFTKIFEFESLIGDVYDVFKYEDLDFKSYKQVKHKDSRWGSENHNRTIYQTNEYFVKVWDEDYIRKDTLPTAFASGFYDSTIVPNFVGLIYDESNICRGYITKECKQLFTKDETDRAVGGSRLVRLTPKSDEHFNEMFTKIKLKTIQSNHFAYDFCEYHTYEFEGKPTLIDLEGVYSCNQYDDLRSHHYNTYTRQNAGDRVDGDYLESPKFFSDFMAQNNYQHFIRNLLATEPINLEYFLNMELQHGSGGKEIIHNDKQIKTVREAIEYFSDEKNRKEAESKLTDKNHQYWNCMWAEFRRNVEGHHEKGWENMTKEYYDSLEMMTDEEIQVALVDDPVNFFGGFLKHGYHRAVAMIGRLIDGKKYIPFYMRKEQIYNEPRKKDGIQRRFPLFNNVKCLKLVDELKIPRGEFTICQSGILALMGIRENDDLDIIISSEARKQLFNDNQQFMRFNGVEIFESNKSKFMYFDAQGDDDLIDNYSFQIDGYNFLEPRFYFSRKNKKTERDLKDWEGIKRFFETESHKGYPFNLLSEEQLGKQFV